MKTNLALAAIAAACLGAALTTPARAGVEQRLGKLMALPVIAKVCNLTLTPAQSDAIDDLGPKLQQEAKISDDELKSIFQTIAGGIKPDDCPGIAAHWAESVPVLIEQAKADQ